MNRIETKLLGRTAKRIWIWIASIFAPLLIFAVLKKNSESAIVAFTSLFLFVGYLIFWMKKEMNSYDCPECGEKLVEDWSKSDAIQRTLSLRCHKCVKLYDTDFHT